MAIDQPIQHLRRAVFGEVKACAERLKAFDLDLWWNELFVFGLIAMVASVIGNDVGLRWVGLGMACLGFGESRNHAVPAIATPTTEIPQAPSRAATPTGVLGTAIGVCLIAYGVYWIVK